MQQESGSKVERPQTHQDRTRELALMLQGAQALNDETRLSHATRSLVPKGWDRAHQTAPCKPKTAKITIRLEKDVLAWYRKLGTGYQNRINQVLRLYMHATIAKLIEQPGDRDWKDDPI